MQTETTPEAETTEIPAPDLSVLAEQPPTEQGKDDKTTPQELAETTPASVGLVVALVVISIAAAVVVAMWMVSPLMALLLGAGLIVVAVLAGAGWLAWRKFIRRDKFRWDRFGRDRAGRSDRTGAARSTKDGKSPTGRGKTGDKSGAGWWPFGRNKTPGGGGKPPAGGKAPGGGGKPTGDGGGKKKPTGDRSGGGWWPFGRNKTPGGGGKPPAGGKAPTGAGKPTGDGGGKKKPTGDGGAKPTSGATGRKAKAVGGTALLGLLSLARAAAKKTKTTDTKTTDAKPAGKHEPAAAKTSHTRPTPGGHRPATVIDVDLDDITSPPRRPGSSSTGSAGPGSARRTGRFFDPGSTAGSEWWDRSAPRPLRTTPHHPHHVPVSHQFGGPEMSTMTSTVDQDAMRVANRYAGLIEKAQTLQERAQACRDAADQYRRDARENQESAENHKMAARTIRDANVAHGHAVAAREAEAEAAREILAARFYEEQAEQYEAQARSIGF